MILCWVVLSLFAKFRIVLAFCGLLCLLVVRACPFACELACEVALRCMLLWFECVWA